MCWKLPSQDTSNCVNNLMSSTLRILNLRVVAKMSLYDNVKFNLMVSLVLGFIVQIIPQNL